MVTPAASFLDLMLLLLEIGDVRFSPVSTCEWAGVEVEVEVFEIGVFWCM